MRLSNSQFNKLKSAIKNETEVVLGLSPDMIGYDGPSFPHKLLLTNRQVANLHKSTTDIKLSKTRRFTITKISWQTSLLKSGLPLMKNVVKPLAKGILNPLGLTAAASAADAGIHKTLLGSGKHLSDWASHNNTILIISNDEMKGIVKIVKFLEDSGLLFKRVSETTQNESKEQRGGFLVCY